MATADAQTLADAKAYADGLAVNYDAEGSADEALEAAKAYTDEQLTAANASTTWGSF